MQHYKASKHKVGYVGYKIKREVRYQARQTRVHFSKIVSVLNSTCPEELNSRPPFAVRVRSEAKSTEKKQSNRPKVMSVLMISSMGLVFVVVRNKLGHVAQAGPVHGEKVEHVERRVVRNVEVTIKGLASCSLDSAR